MMIAVTVLMMLCQLATVPTPTQVALPDGPVNCVLTGNRTRQCLALPYAQPPLEELRWSPPQPPKPWTVVRDATRQMDACYQRGRGVSEDCLYLNVFAPRMLPPASSPGRVANSDMYAVVIYIHGGSYMTGTGGQHNASTIVELSGDVIWVAINYRLNVFGFLGADALRTKDPNGATGNSGLQDQRAAMAWVQRSIKAFGGDASRVTIDGCSAGAGSTANHFVSKNSWPYFTQAAAAACWDRYVAGESGMFAPWNSKPLALANNIYNELLAATGCTSLGCMSNKTSYEIYKASEIAQGKATVPGNPWAPTVDGIELTGMPNDLVRARHHHPTAALLLGTARDEGTTFVGVPGTFTQPQWEAWAKEKYPTFNFAEINNLYGSYPATPGLSKWYWAAARTDGDLRFHCGARLGARAVASHGRDVYYYSFAPGEIFNVSYHADTIGHCSERSFIFHSLPPSDDGPAGKLQLAMVAAWRSFAKHGDPNAEPLIGRSFDLRDGSKPTTLQTHWPKYVNATDQVLVWVDGAGGDVVLDGYRAEECKFWGQV
eukprot:gene11819-30337_t